MTRRASAPAGLEHARIDVSKHAARVASDAAPAPADNGKGEDEGDDDEDNGDEEGLGVFVFWSTL